MDLSKLRAITNNYQDVRLISLRAWKRASEIVPRDHGGPYAVAQEGYDPSDIKAQSDEFILAKCGKWVRTAVFFKLNAEVRRQQFVFGTAAEALGLLEKLTGKVSVARSGEELNAPECESEPDDLSTTFAEARKESSTTERPPEVNKR